MALRKKKRLKSGSKPSVTVDLPMENSKIVSRLDQATILIHGEKKIGKTSTLAQEPDAFFLEFDPPQGSLAIKQRHIADWKTLLAYVNKLEEVATSGKFPYKTGVVDGADIMYQLAFDYVCGKKGVAHPTDIGGYEGSAVWKAIRNEFHGVHRRLMALPWAMRYICHSRWRDIKSRGGEKIEKLVPLLSGQAAEIIEGDIDIWAAMIYVGNERVLILEGDESIAAGQKFENQFRTPKGRAIVEVPMGESPQESYRNLLNAWENRQTFTTLEERDRKAEKKGGVKRKPKANAN